jgi:hypothetical protein
MRLRASIMQMKQASFTTASQSKRWRDHPWRKSAKEPDSATVQKQQWFIQMTALHYWMESLVKTSSLKNVKKLPVTYCANSKTWMMTDFLHVLDASFSAQYMEVLPFIGNCSTHSTHTSFMRNVPSHPPLQTTPVSYSLLI